VTVAQLTVTAVGVAAIVWVLWYFLFSTSPAVAAAVSDGVQEVRVERYAAGIPFHDYQGTSESG